MSLRLLLNLCIAQNLRCIGLLMTSSWLQIQDHVILVHLDLTAAFDTVFGNILLSRMEHWIGICGTALQWLENLCLDT